MLLPFLFCVVLFPGPSDPIVGESLSIKADDLARLPIVEVSVPGEKGATKYRGVPLAAILARRERPIDGMPGLRDLSDAILLVRGADGYQTVVSAAAVAMDTAGERYLLATARDGEARPPQLIVPGDPKHVRWVRDVVAVRLVRLRGVVPPEG